MMVSDNDNPVPNADDTAEIEEVRARQVALIGQRVRQLRRDRMTLTQLAQASNVSIGLLSRLENGVGNPSFTVLTAIARALDVDVHAFFEAPLKEQVIDTNGCRITFQRESHDAVVEMLVPSLSSRIIAAVVTLPPDAPHQQPDSARPGQQYEFLIDGVVEYRIDHEVHELTTGDFILFDAGRPHSRRNLSTTDHATILSCSVDARLESFFPPR